MADPIFNFRWNQQPMVTNPLQPNMGVATPTINTMTPNMKPDTAAQVYQEATPEQNGNAVPAQHTMNNFKTRIDNLKAEREKLLAEKSKLESYNDPVKKNAMMEANRARRFRKDNDSLMQYRWRKEQEAEAIKQKNQMDMHAQVAKTAKEGRYQSAYDMASRAMNECLMKASILGDGDEKRLLEIEAGKYDQQMKDIAKQALAGGLDIAGVNKDTNEQGGDGNQQEWVPLHTMEEYLAMDEDVFKAGKDAAFRKDQDKALYQKAEAARATMKADAQQAVMSGQDLTPEMKAAGYSIKVTKTWDKDQLNKIEKNGYDVKNLTGDQKKFLKAPNATVRTLMFKDEVVK